jgi:class I fructose-bisphosphate aldolase
MNIGKKVRMERLFSHPTGNFFSVALDHFIGYDLGLPYGLRQVESTLDKLVEAKPDAVTINKGIVLSCWAKHAGKVPLIVQSVICRPDVPHLQQLVNPEEAVKMGADAIAVSLFVRGTQEIDNLKVLAETVRAAAQFDLPVIPHLYPRKFNADNKPYISTEPEDIAWAVRCAVEMGADVVKVPYCGDLEAHRQIVQDCPVPIVSAGGPATKTFKEALQLVAEVVAAGARGATVGRNIWGSEQVVANALAYKAVIHEGLTPDEAIARYLPELANASV